MSRIDVRSLGIDYINVHGRTTRVLIGVDLLIDAGEFVVALGASDCGKTALPNCLAGSVVLISGQILLDSREIGGPGTDRGVAFQRYGPMPRLNVRNNVALGPRLRGVGRKTRHVRALELFRLTSLEVHAASPVHALSSGTQRHVGIARVLATEPRMLLMDESMGVLDAFTHETMQTLMPNVWQRTDTTAFFITHDMEEALLLAARLITVSPSLGRAMQIFDSPSSWQALAGGDAHAVKSSSELTVQRKRVSALIYHTPEALLA